MIQIYVVVKNVSNQLVRMYVTRRGIESNTSPKACLGPPGRFGRGLQPGQQAGTISWQGVSNSDPAPAVWIDFVELSDGTRWGADECQKGERLDGERAGMRVQRDQLLKILRDKGADALMEFIKEKAEANRRASERREQPVFPDPPPMGHSRNWEEAFSEGAREMVRRVVDAEHDWGADEIEHVLLRPIEPSQKKAP